MVCMVELLAEVTPAMHMPWEDARYLLALWIEK